MRRFLLALLLLPPPWALASDPGTERFRKFLAEEITGKYPSEEVSDQRVVMLRSFEKHDVTEASRWLVQEVLLKETAGDVLREAVRVLGTYNNPDNVEDMAKAYSRLSKSPDARALMLAAFGAMKIDTALKPIAAGLKDPSPRVAAAACRAAGAGRRLSLRPDLEALLKHKHASVRAAALRGLAGLHGDDSLPVIFKAFCGDPSPLVRYDAWIALKKLAKEELPCDPAAWAEFWKKMAGEVAEGEKNPWGTTFPRIDPKAGRAGGFFGIPVLGGRVCFVVDTTRDMSSPWKIDHQAERAKPPEERTPNFFNVKTRWGLVRAHVTECLSGASESMEVAFVFFNEKPFPWPETGKFLPNVAKSREAVEAHLETGTRLASITAMYEGLAAGWGFVKGGAEGNFEQGADTIIFLTDGRPTHGELANRPERLRDEVWLVATLRNVRFHTVGIHNHQFDLLQAMARDSGGLYVHVQQAGDTAEPQDLEFWPAKKKAFEEARKARKKAEQANPEGG
jgi:hypothetical protein